MTYNCSFRLLKNVKYVIKTVVFCKRANTVGIKAWQSQEALLFSGRARILKAEKELAFTHCMFYFT